MSLYKGNNLISGISQNTKYNAHHLLDFKWSDCIMNDVSWLRADTFSWQSGEVYVLAYNHLVQDIQGITAETETVGSYTITFYRATDGHKICLADQEQTVADIYDSYGVAWYYIVDTANTQFKLPRTKYGFEGFRTNVGDKIDESLPNHTHTVSGDDLRLKSSTNGDNAVLGAGGSLSGWGIATTKNNAGNAKLYVAGNTSETTNATYQDNAPVQERATQMYLYFYIGDYSQTAIEQTAGLNSELFNGKADINLANVNDQAKILISGMAMPSNRYIDLALGASGTTYIAPANGWFLSRQNYNSGYYEISIDNINLAETTASSIQLSFLVPARKGQGLRYSYSNLTTGTTYAKFRFIYAQGSESEVQ